jgi:hypothetical protein
MKMTKVLHLILALFVILFFVECKNNKYKKELARIDSLETVLNQSEKKLTEVDTNMVREKYKVYKKNISFISENYPNKLKDPNWNTLCQYGLIKKPLRDFNNELPHLRKELMFSRKQLDSLKFDIQNGNIEKEKINEYVKSESDAVNVIEQMVKMTVEGAKTELNRFDTLNPKIEKILMGIKKK